MKYFSTRDKNQKVSSAQAIARGLAPDGGLYIPEEIPEITGDELNALRKMNYRERAVWVMSRYLDDFTEQELRGFADKAYGENYDDPGNAAPLRRYNENTAFLELWHGPTCAFKDMALQMLPHLLTASIKKCGEKREVCILVATSGDTGKAALDGFADVPGTRIIVFYPENGVSEIQKLQMLTQKGCNVLVSAIEGNFDDAQTGVKEIFNDARFAEVLSERGYMLSSANSMNWGRLLPQIVYYVSAYCDAVNSGFINNGGKLNVCVPTGNFGNILAGWLAKRMGVPIGRLICASNENNVLTDFIKTGIYDRNREFHTTISPSMDILVSSNLERLIYGLSGDDKLISGYMSSLMTDKKYEVSAGIKDAIKTDFDCGCCNDAQTREEIGRVFAQGKYLIDTHTAVASRVLGDYRAKTGDMTPCVVVSTASPYKFAADVLEALGGKSQGSAALDALEKVSGTAVPAALAGLKNAEVLFDKCVSKSDMKSLVSQYLS